LRERVLADMAATWADSDPAKAAELAVRELSPGTRQSEAVLGIVQRWVQNQPEQAAAWVAAFPSGTLRDTALEELVKLWSDRSMQAVADWLNGGDLSSGRDVAIGAYVGKVATESPEAAARWAAEIGDDEMRLREMEMIGENWMARDAVAARAWIEQTTLSDSAKSRLLALQR
jgi:hypothetical protein